MPANTYGLVLSPRAGPARIIVSDFAASVDDLAISSAAPEIARATALRDLGSVANSALATRAAPLLKDKNPLVWAAAIGVQRGASPAQRFQRVAPLLQDRFRAVRIAAARALVDAPLSRLKPTEALALSGASAEWRAALRARADFPEVRLIEGGISLMTRDFTAAEAAFREAVLLDPNLTDAWTMIVRIRDAHYDHVGAGEALDNALRANPNSLPLLKLDRRRAR